MNKRFCQISGLTACWVAVCCLVACRGDSDSRHGQNSAKAEGLTLSKEVEVPEVISFNRHVRPIISDNCYACHGPDAQNQESSFRLDSAEASRMNLAQEGEPERYGIVPGKPDVSLALQRILTDDPHEVMPPLESKKPELTETEIGILTKWIAEGAEYEEHWAFVPPVKSELPRISDDTWPRNFIDHFVLAKLDQHKLIPSETADPETLVRRLYLDLLGLPPTPEQIDAFVQNPAEDAYEKLVDRILSSPHYGERMAIDWLDVARYGDTNAIHADLMRSSWPWRDWVIQAFNANMPYDQFIIEQLAGDLLPNATRSQKVATSFNRNHGITNEGGVIPEEYLIEYAVDRVSTIGTAFMGLTLACARCHDHKFDPISQDDFFSMVAFVNSIPEKGKEIQNEHRAMAYPPYIALYTEAEERAVEEKKKLEQWLKQAINLEESGKAKLAQDNVSLDWEGLSLSGVTDITGDKPKKVKLVNHQGSKKPNTKILGKNKVTQLKENKEIYWRENLKNDARIALTFEKPKKAFNLIRLEANPLLIFPEIDFDPAQFSSSLREFEVLAVNGENEIPLTVKSAWSTVNLYGGRLDHAFDGDFSTAWNAGVLSHPYTIFINLQELDHNTKGQLRIKISFKGKQSERRMLENFTVLTAYNNGVADSPLKLIPSDERQEWQRNYLRVQNFDFFKEKKVSPEDYQLAVHQGFVAQKAAVRVMVMEESPEPRKTYVLDRGLYDKPLKDRERLRVTPAALPPMADDLPKNRLGLAKWLVDAQNPLTARVAVNRVWQIFFRHGIVKTSEDFGLQSSPPTHPKLLDTLAVDFMESGWDMKRLIKQIVMSSTYRQSSRIREEVKQVDPENQLLATAQRFRLPAEMIRDNALTASGLLNNQIGGPSVKPYQPPGLWREKTMRPGSNTGVFKRDTGDKLYRRGMYTFWKQASPPPQMELFDAPSREACQVKRPITNTPLQALMLMNDETYLEMSRALAARVMSEIEGEWQVQMADRIRRGLRLATGRVFSDEELAQWIVFTNENYEKFSQNPERTKSFLKYGEFQQNENLSEIELAALAFTMSAAYNLDETITRD